MPEYNVLGTVELAVSLAIEADDEEAAKTEASKFFNNMHHDVGEISIDDVTLVEIEDVEDM